MNWFKNLGWAVLIIAFLMFANLGYILEAVTPPPLTYNNLPFPLEKDTYYPGDSLKVSVERCVQTSIPIVAVSTRHFINVYTNEIITLGADFRTLQPGCVSQDSILYGIVPVMPQGRYKLEGIIQINSGSRTYEILWDTEEFDYRWSQDT